MPDAGSYIYSGDPEGRNWFRQTKIHQTLTLNGENSRYEPELSLWKPGKDLDILVVENKSYPELNHRRSVFFVDKKYFIIVDDAIGKATGDIDLHFQLAPGKAVYNYRNFSVSSGHPEGWNVLVRTLDQKGMKLVEEKGWVSFRYTIKEPRPAFCYNLKKETKDQTVRFITVITPCSGSQPEIKVDVKDISEPGYQKILLKVKSEGKSRKIGYEIN